MLTARLELLGLKTGDRILDLGCGEGRHVHGLHLFGDFEIVGVGLASLAGEGSDRRGNVRFEIGNATALQFADDSFDVVICSEVLEHLPDYHRALAEIRRVLKPDGRLCISVPRAWPERICWKLAPAPGGYALEPGGHIRIFDDGALQQAVEQHGFIARHRHHAHGLHAPYWWLKCALWERRDNHPLIRAYHRMLVWDLMQKPALTRILDAMLTPIMGKSVVLYFSNVEGVT